MMSSYTWLVGALLAAMGSIASNLGVNCQKFSFMQNAKLPKSLQKKHIRQKGWLFGMALVVLGSLGDFAALSLAAQSIVAPIGSITLVANVFFAHYWLKEAIGWVELIGTTMIVTGSVCAVAFGDHSDAAYDIHAILRFFYGTTFIIYATVSVALGVALYRFQLPITPIKQKIVDATKRYETAYDTHDLEQLEYEDFYIAQLSKAYHRWEKIHPFTICALSGILGGQSVMFGKMVSEMLNVTAQGDNQLLSPFFYVFIGCMLLCVIGQLQYLAIALSFFDALYVVPVFQCFFIAFSTLGGASFFSEFSEFSAVQAVMFPVGLFTTLGGVVVLTRRKMGSGDRKRLLDSIGVEGSKDEMEVIEEGDEAEGEQVDGEEEESEVLKMEKRRIKKERKKQRRLRRKQGYQGLTDEDEDGSSSLSETSEEEEKEESEDEEILRRFTLQLQAGVKPLEETKQSVEDKPATPSRVSPLRPVSTGSTPTRSPTHGAARERVTPLPNIEDLMEAAVVASGTTPPQAERRVSLTSSGGSTDRDRDRRQSLDRRLSLPRRPSRSPQPLATGSDEAQLPSSAPSTPSSLSRQPTIFRSGTLAMSPASSASSGLMQPSIAQYMPPPTGMDLWTRGEPVQEKVKKYSSVAHHAGGLVGVPLVSAIAHAYTIAKEERQEERREQAEVKQREDDKRGEERRADEAAAAVSLNAADASSSVEMEELHPSTLSPVPAGPNVPVAEPVIVDGGGVHHAHHPSIYGRIRGKFMDVFYTEQAREGREAQVAAEEDLASQAGQEGQDPPREQRSEEERARAEEREQLTLPTVDDAGPSDGADAAELEGDAPPHM